MDTGEEELRPSLSGPVKGTSRVKPDFSAAFLELDELLADVAEGLADEP